MQDESVYTINQLAKFSGVTVRTLRHYDDIGLLIPSGRNQAGHRVYDVAGLLRLQQIMFYRELDMSLTKIAEILDDPDFSIAQALTEHRKRIDGEMQRLQKLLGTIDTTLDNYNSLMDDKTKEELLYEGFSKEEVDEMNAEVDRKYDPKIVAESRAKVAKMSKQDIEEMKQEAQDIMQGLVELMHKEVPADSDEPQKWIGMYVKHLHRFYTPTAEIVKGLGEMYVQDPRFTAYYEKIETGLAQYVSDGMVAYSTTMA